LHNLSHKMVPWRLKT